jgi:hypothetical protein
MGLNDAATARARVIVDVVAQWLEEIRLAAK